ncbi:iron ABC transporter permease [Halostella sp. JP-L12]|uniref:ABC transporter permease n=1 Tax=Halostella TaxID=1843185 RepID=UPI000EF85023|nr:MULTISPECIES: iron ABC transporter permease [Halostella]NHN48895.1 iron ABC transporter permease [Halostella sp. JP-L12]
MAAEPGTTATGESTDAGDEPRSYPVGLTFLSGAVAAGSVLPLFWLIETAFRTGVAEPVSLLFDPLTLQVLVNSVVLVTSVTVASVLISVPLAYLTVRTDLPFRRFWTVAVMLPLVIPSYIGAFAFVSVFSPNGEVQSLLAPLGVEELPGIYGLEGTVLVLTLYTYPYVYITSRASLKTLDTSLVDAARTLKHTRWEAFKRVVVPQIRPAVAAGALLTALYTLSDFGTPQIMRYSVFTRIIYTRWATSPEFAAVLSIQLLAVTVLILAVESQIRGDDTLHGSGGSAHSSGRMRLGRWKWPALAFPALVVGLALAVPIGTLLLWLVRGGATGSGVPFELEYVANSVDVSLAAALVATLAGLPVAYLSARHSTRLGDLFERITYVGYAVPGVVMGLALVFVGINVAPSLYLTLPLLIFAYVVRFLPQSVGSTRASFLQVNPALPEAARTLGRSSIGAFRAVTLPLAAPGLLGGAALVFLTTMKELPATLMLSPSGYKTLVTYIWQMQEDGYYGDAAVPALVLVAISALSIFVIISQEGYDVK